MISENTQASNQWLIESRVSMVTLQHHFGKLVGSVRVGSIPGIKEITS